MRKLIITDGENMMKLEDNKCIPLELIFNKSEYGKEWKFIGDHLFYFVYNKNEFGEDKASDVLQLNNKQYNFLKDLINTLQ